MREIKQNKSENEGGIRRKRGRGSDDRQQRERNRKEDGRERGRGGRIRGPLLLDLVASFGNRILDSGRST